MGPQRKVRSAAHQRRTRLIAKSLLYASVLHQVRILEPWIPQTPDYKVAL